MKKSLSLLLSLVMVISLASCNGTKQPAPGPNGSQGQDQNAGTTAEWPKAKNITILCAAPAGGNTDAQCRIFADHMNRTYSGHNFIVENDGSGNGVVAFEKVRNAEPNGDLLLFYHNGLDIMRAIGRYDYSMSDFTLLGQMVDQQFAYFLVVPANSKYQTLEDLVEDALSSPGKVTTGTMFAGSRQMLIGSFIAATGTDINSIDTGAEADTIAQVIGGNVDFSFISYNNAKNYSESGDIRILAYCGDERLESDPDIRTIKEVYPGFSNCFNLPFLLGPTGMDPALAEAINASFQGMEDDEAVQESYGNMKQTFTWFDLDTTQELFQEQLQVIDTAAKALGY